MKRAEKTVALLLAVALGLCGCAQSQTDAPASQADTSAPTASESTPRPDAPVAEGVATREYALNLFAYTIGRNTLRMREPANLAQYADNGDLTGDYRYNIALLLGNGLDQDMEAPSAAGGEGGPLLLRPKEAITRLEALLLLANCMPKLAETSRQSGFTDVPDYAKARIDSLVAAGYLSVPSDGLLRGDAPATIAEVDGYAALVDEQLTPVKPEDDFYTYVNRYAFRNQYSNSDQEINAGAQKVTWSYFRDASIRVLTFERDMLDEILAGDGAAYADGSLEKKIYDLYQLYLASDSVGAAPLKPFFERIDACASMDALYDLLVDMTVNYGFLPLFYIGSMQEVGDDGVEHSYVDLLPNLYTTTGFIAEQGKLTDYLDDYQAAYETFLLACGVPQSELDAVHGDELSLELALAKGIDQEDNFFTQALVEAVWNKENGLPLTDKGASAAELLAQGTSENAKAAMLSRDTDAALLGGFDLFRYLDDCSGGRIDKVHVEDLQFIENIGACWAEENLAAWKLMF